MSEVARMWYVAVCAQDVAEMPRPGPASAITVQTRGCRRPREWTLTPSVAPIVMQMQSLSSSRAPYSASYSTSITRTRARMCLTASGRDRALRVPRPGDYRRRHTSTRCSSSDTTGGIYPVMRLPQRRPRAYS